MLMRNRRCWAAGFAAMLIVGCSGCGFAASPENTDTPEGGTTSSSAAASEELDSTLEAVRTALQRQCEEGAIRCGYVVDRPEAFLDTFELEQWEPVRFTRFPAEADLSFTLSDSLSLLVSEEAGLAQIQLGEWEKEEKVYRLPEGPPPPWFGMRGSMTAWAGRKAWPAARPWRRCPLSMTGDGRARFLWTGAAFPVDGGGVAKAVGAHGSLGPLCPAVPVGVLHRHLLAGYR